MIKKLVQQVNQKINLTIRMASFPSDTEYTEMLRRLPKYNKLNLTTGNCGIFAISLQELFNVGTLVAFGSKQDRDFSHVLLEYNGYFYDGEGIHTLAHIVDRWEENGNEPFIDNVTKAEVLKNTACPMTVDQMKPYII